ncbi:death domain-associated protein 6 [Numenius arquata]|uniref:death domain-associated protein 6 n=1 Tax=Numenius arquata TaxID=31919 RepID=UPI003D30BE09
MAAPPADGVIVLDDEDEGVPSGGKGGGGYKAENERLFGEFLELCTPLTEEHPEVIPFLLGRHQKATPEFLSSAELRNVLSRCLGRVRARPNKVYVYINELCTLLKAHTLRRKLAPVPVPAVPTTASPSPTPPDATPAPPAASPGGSKRQIRYLENLLRVYTGEIRRLQERELDLAELDSEDSPYLQESRLKRRMMRIFERLCQLKRCSSLTGRVIEQRIPYRGTRYPEVNRRIERFINRPEAFPDYTDILKVIQKASARHSLGLARRQMESMAQDAFREVGNRLQERRHLDLVYNFGSHLTDQYRPGTDPALVDPELAKRLRKNRTVALTRLDSVISHYAQLQDESEEEERGRKRAARQQGPPSHTPGGPPTPPPAPAQVRGDGDGDGDEDNLPLKPCLQQESAGKEEEEEEEEEEESEEEDSEEEEEEEEDESEEAEGNQGKVEEEEEEERGDEGDTGSGQQSPRRCSSPAKDEGVTVTPQEEEEAGGEVRKRPPSWSPPPELFVLEIEPLPLEPGETPPASPCPPPAPGGSEAIPKAAPPSPQPSHAPTPPAPTSPGAVSPWTAPPEPGLGEGGHCPLWIRTPQKGKRPPPASPQPLENGEGEDSGDVGGGMAISSTSFNGGTEPPPCKRSRLDLPPGASPCIEVHSVGSEEEEEGGGSRGAAPPPAEPPPPRLHSG